MVNVIMPVVSLTYVFCEKISSFCRTLTLSLGRGLKKSLSKNVKALSIARVLAGTEQQSMAASYSITWPQHYVYKWISDCSADNIVARAVQYLVDTGGSQRNNKSHYFHQLRS